MNDGYPDIDCAAYPRVYSTKASFSSGMKPEFRIPLLVKFEIYSDSRFWCGRGIGVEIFTQGKILDELTENICAAAELHSEEELTRAESIRILPISECEVDPPAQPASCYGERPLKFLSRLGYQVVRQRVAITGSLVRHPQETLHYNYPSR
jgi:hypothetical protein